MPFQPQTGQFYRMPIFFGPMPGPRQWPEGRTFDFRTTPRMRMIGIRMRTNPDQLTAMLPDRFELRGDPIVTVELNYMTEIGWLAGRGGRISRAGIAGLNGYVLTLALPAMLGARSPGNE